MNAQSRHRLRVKPGDRPCDDARGIVARRFLLPHDRSGERFGFFLPSVVVTAQLPKYYQFYAEFVGQTKLGPEQGGRTFTDFACKNCSALLSNSTPNTA